MTNTQNDQPYAAEGCTTYQDLLAPLFTWRGRDIYSVCGAEGDDGDDDGSDGDPDSDGEDTGGTGATTDGSGTVTREEFDQLRNQLSAADKRRDAAEKKLKDLDDAKKDELTKATERAQELEKTVQQRDKDIAELRLQNAFLTAETGITWHDPADALALAERQGYLAEVVAEDGKVDQGKLKVKLKELAKAKPHLVKTDTAPEGSKTKEDPKPPTGQKVGSKGTNGKTGEPALPSRYDKYTMR